MIDVFKVGVHIGMTSNATHVLSTMLHQLTGVHVAANKVQGSLNAIRTAAIGAGAVFAGWLVIKGLTDATKHAEKLNHELVKLQIGASLDDKQTEQAKVLAFKVSRDVKGTEVHENVKQQRELFGVFGNMETAKQLLPMVAKGSAAVGSFVDKDTDLAQIAVRALELRGHITKDHKVDPKMFADEFNALVRSIVASEGLVDPKKLFQFIRQAGPAARTMTAEEMWGYSPAIMNALGAERAGTAMMSFYQQMVGHVVAGKRVAIAMEEAGMLKPGKWAVERGGKVRMDRDAVVDQDRATTNPIEWVHERMMALRERKGPDGKPLDEVGIIQRIFQFASRQTTARFISDIDANWPIIHNELDRFKRMPDIDAIRKEQNDKDLSVNVKNLHAAWDNFMAALGGPGIPIAIKVLDSLTNTLNVFQAAIVNHPDAAKTLFALSGGIASLTILGGGLVILNAAWAPLVSGLTLLTGIPGLAAAGGLIASVASGLTTLIAPIAALAAIMKIGSDYETPETRSALDKLGRDQRGANGGPHGKTFDGFGPDGSPLPEGALRDPLGLSKRATPSAPSAMPNATAGNSGQPSNGPAQSPFVSPKPSDGTGKRSGDVYLDGKKVGMIIERHSADRLSRPQSGPTGADYRVTPLMPGRVG